MIAGRRSFGIWGAAAFGTIVTTLFFYPGVMSPDSLGAYHDATTGVISGGAQAPVLAFIWKFLLAVAPTPAVLLIFQNLIFWAGLALIATALRTGAVGGAAIVLGIGLFPPVFALLGILWKDVLMGASLTLFVGIVLNAEARRSKGLLVTAALALLLAMSLRVNAFGAIPPLLIWWMTVWSGERGGSARRRIALALVLTFVLYGATQAINRVVSTGPMGASERSLQFSIIHDLAGIGLRTGDLRVPDYLARSRPDFTLEAVRASYDVADINTLMYNRWWTADDLVTSDRSELWALITTWLGAIAAHPAAYLAERTTVAAAVYQVRADVFYPFHTGIDPNDLGLAFNADRVYTGVTSWLEAHRGWFFRGWVFGLVAGAVCVVALRRKHYAAAAVSGSGLLYVLPYVVVSAGADFRFVWWLVVATFISACLLMWHAPRRT